LSVWCLRLGASARHIYDGEGSQPSRPPVNLTRTRWSTLERIVHFGASILKLPCRVRGTTPSTLQRIKTRHIYDGRLVMHTTGEPLSLSVSLSLSLALSPSLFLAIPSSSSSLLSSLALSDTTIYEPSTRAFPSTPHSIAAGCGVYAFAAARELDAHTLVDVLAQVQHRALLLSGLRRTRTRHVYVGRFGVSGEAFD